MTPPLGFGRSGPPLAFASRRRQWGRLCTVGKRQGYGERADETSRSGIAGHLGASNGVFDQGITGAELVRLLDGRTAALGPGQLQDSDAIAEVARLPFQPYHSGRDLQRAVFG